MVKTRCNRGSRKCMSKCVSKNRHTKTKRCAKGSRKCADQVCHKKTVRRIRGRGRGRGASKVVSKYSLRSRRVNQ